MDHELCNKAKLFLAEYLNGKVCHFEVTYPWRRDSRYLMLHALRTHRLALKIIEQSAEKPTQEEQLILELAALFHDIGKVHGHECHAERSAEIVDKWIRSDNALFKSVKDPELLFDVIAKHSDKDDLPTSTIQSILMDADSLDEIGVLSIFMASGRIDHHSPWFFNQLEDRLQNTEIPYCENLMKTLRTSGARELLSKDIQFIQYFIQKLKDEIEGTEELYRGLGEEPELMDFGKLKGMPLKAFEL